jgi:N-acetylglutamate synthase-like GNAT family acetyltransferase
LELARRNGDVLRISRAVPFTPVEKERAQALVSLVRDAKGSSARVSTLPSSTVPVVRQATLADVEAVADLHDRCSDETLFNRYQVPLQLPMKARMTRRLVAPDNGVALVVQQGQEVVAHGLLELVDETWTFRLLIQDAYAGGNLGTLLVKHAASHAKASGADRLTLITAESNDSLLRAVGNAGFMARIERRDGSVHISVPLAAVRAIETG